MPAISIMVKPVSGACNMRCTYCFYQDVSEHREKRFLGTMSETTLENLVRKAFTYADGEISFAFQGGEPTLAGIPFYRKFLALEKRYNTRNLNVHNAIQTNGWGIDSDWIQLFLDGNFLVGVSVDGTQELHDRCRIDANGGKTYARVLENIGLLRENGVQYNILCVVNRQIAEHAGEVFESLKEHRYLQFIPCLDGFDGEKSEWSLDGKTYGQFLIETFDRYEAAWRQGNPVSIRNFDNWIGMLMGRAPESCALSGRCACYFLIEADGSVYPCDFYVLDAWKMGNINDTSFLRLSKSQIAEKFRQDSWKLPEDCAQCQWFSLCRGGCKRDREPVQNGCPSANRLCEGHKMFFEACEDRMKTLIVQNF